MSLVLSNKGKGMQSSSEQPLVGEERYATTRITAAKETNISTKSSRFSTRLLFLHFSTFRSEERRSIYFFDVISYQVPTGSTKICCV